MPMHSPSIPESRCLTTIEQDTTPLLTLTLERLSKTATPLVTRHSSNRPTDNVCYGVQRVQPGIAECNYEAVLSEDTRPAGRSAIR